MDAGEKKRRATYQDILDTPEHKVAEIIAGELHVASRPGVPASAVQSRLFLELGSRFRDDGKTGWILLVEPELHLGEDIVVPDIAGWRVERMQELPEGAFFESAPDWICEVLSRSTEKRDRAEKMPLYARAGVQHAWLVHPVRRTLEAFRLHETKWLAIATLKDDDRGRIEPFDSLELDLLTLWLRLPLPTRASEEAGEYVVSYSGTTPLTGTQIVSPEPPTSSS